MNGTSIVQSIKRQKVTAWLEVTARTGFAAKGMIYIIIGYLAFKVVLGMGGKTEGMKDVLMTINKQAGPFGDILLACLAAGLIAHAYWRLMQSVFNADNYEVNFKNIINRIGYFTSVIFYGSLTFYSLKIIFEFGSSNSTQGMVASVLSKPFGTWIIGFVGLCIGGSGLFQIYYGIFSKFEFKYELNKMSNFEEKLCRYISIVGLAARGIVFVLISILLVQSAMEFNPDKAGGIDKALLKALYQPYGHWLLGAAAVGLAAYGGYCIILAKYRKIPIHRER